MTMEPADETAPKAAARQRSVGSSRWLACACVCGVVGAVQVEIVMVEWRIAAS